MTNDKVQVIMLTETDPSAHAPGETRWEVTHYVLPNVALRACDVYYTGSGDGEVYVETQYNLMPLGESPHNVRCPSADAYIERNRSACETPKMFHLLDVTSEIGRILSSYLDDLKS